MSQPRTTDDHQRTLRFLFLLQCAAALFLALALSRDLGPTDPRLHVYVAVFIMVGVGYIILRTVRLVWGRYRGLEADTEASQERRSELESWYQASDRQLRSTSLRLEATLDELDFTQEQLAEAQNRAGRAELSSHILHTVGEHLGTVDMSAGALQDQVTTLGFERLSQLLVLIDAHGGDIVKFVSEDRRGAKLPEFLAAWLHHHTASREALISEVVALRREVDLIRNLVSTQHDVIAAGGSVGRIDLGPALVSALAVSSINQQEINVDMRATSAAVRCERQGLLSILVSLLTNARDVVTAGGTANPTIEIKVTERGEEVAIEVRDNGPGLTPTALERVFDRGFDGIGVLGGGSGLHNAALEARAMGAQLEAESDGAWQGTTVRLIVACHDASAIATTASAARI